MEDVISNLSPCVRSAVIIFKKNGTYTEVFPVKDCEDQLIEDTYGTWTSSQDMGLLKIEMRDLVNIQDWRTYYILTLTDQNMIASDLPPGQGQAETRVFKSQSSAADQDETYVYEQEESNTQESDDSVADEIDLSKFYSKDEILKANTAVNSTYMSVMDRDVILYCNLARMYPKKFKQMIEAYVENQPAYIKSSYDEDREFYGSLLDELESMDALAPLYPDKPMYDQAMCWAEESGRLGAIGHDRVTCKEGYWGENCSYGDRNAHNVVFSLLIDFEVPSLGHRANIFRELHRGIGVATATHKEYGICTVQDFSISTDWERDNGLKMKQRFYDIMNTNWTAEEIKQADINRALPYLNPFEKDFFLYVNLMRMNPAKFGKLLWTPAPLFQPVLLDKETEEIFKVQYAAMTAWFKEAQPMKPVVPDFNRVKDGRCMAKRWEEQTGNAEECLRVESAWSVSSGLVGEDPFNDLMNSFSLSPSFPYALESDDVLMICEGADRLSVTQIILY